MYRPIIFVTGPNTGLGLEIVKSLFQFATFYTVLLGSRREDNADLAVQQLAAEFPDSATVVTPVQVDIEDDKSIQQAFDFIAKQHSRVDGLINNAGKVETCQIWGTQSIETVCSQKSNPGAQFDSQMYSRDLTMREMWNKSWNVNATGTQILTHTFVPLLLESGDPRLLFITSGTSPLTETDNLDLPFNRAPAKGWPKSSPAISAYRSSKSGEHDDARMDANPPRGRREDLVRFAGLFGHRIRRGCEAEQADGCHRPSYWGEHYA